MATITLTAPMPVRASGRPKKVNPYLAAVAKCDTGETFLVALADGEVMKAQVGLLRAAANTIDRTAVVVVDGPTRFAFKLVARVTRTRKPATEAVEAATEAVEAATAKVEHTGKSASKVGK